MRHLVGRLVLAGFVAGGASCQLLASVDRDEIPKEDGSGGAASSSSSTGAGPGSGASGGEGATGGSGGGGRCATPSDCGSNECMDYTCDDGSCSETPKRVGTPIGRQTNGDCLVNQCDGAGTLEQVPDDGDLPDDTNDCTDDVCTNGTPSHPAEPADTSCGATGNLVCDGRGNCVGCLDPDDCIGQDSECQQRKCTEGVCGVTNAPQGTALVAQTDGDCQVAQCNGMGVVQSAENNSDLPVDDLQCTLDLCSGGVPSNPEVPASTPCTEGTGTLCNASGVCVECLGPANCPGVDDDCKTRTCTAGVCGFDFSPLGTPVSTQTDNDCKQNECNGLGLTVVANDDTDLPVDSNACTSDVCSAGVPSNPILGNGTACGVGLTCVGGACTGCAGPTDCPGTDDECKTRTCTAGTCGFAFTAAATPVAAQTAANCQTNVCDGAGSVQSIPDGADLPVDSNQCTSDLCTNGVPSHPLVPTDTPCNQLGGSVCSATGQCVACNIATQCPGNDTDCQTRSCTGGMCGFTFAPPGTPTSSQTAGDCKVSQCNGSGGVTVGDDNGDLPADDGQQCTGEVCNGGTPQHPALAVNTPCTQGGGSFCSAAGTCVQCNLASQCTSMVCNAATHTCSAATCSDNVKNGSETDVDCGGSCSGCEAGEVCAVHADCSGGACNPTTLTCAPTCAAAEAAGATCTSYCTCMGGTCPGKFANTAECITACATFVESQLCCRAYHCIMAGSDQATHCPHAAGESVCP